ncbi:multidrug ABC transporter ATPase [Anaerocolumna cellulosilytica]|uniref:Multidrug ABC transporter ATPase n=1 Tax=Anaerocolumna cellulosilytica TaxID=433286 RepID=A0A6S6R2P1_9FIRM|nr:ABC transporter ATP-binding protein [Anaerocolumna cellulosilytica]MBB5195521.1 ABC-2 type transport system ATP-binding protein [Anaerocolumna cellulosilytica]BCJ93762.1 multidrug ABC transporter ATPase [Anaerocolumna cellulosilytica]
METTLEVTNLKKSYQGKEVVDNISFQVFEKDIIGFIGPNGAGKSTTIKLLTALFPPDTGQIYYRKEDIHNNLKVYKRSLGIVPQDLAFYEDLTAYDNVSFFCSLYGFKRKELKQQVKEALNFVGLWDRRGDFPTTFSGGMKRRLNIACAIAHHPELLIMDEPTVGIDPQSRNHILDTVRTLNQRGTTVIYISHYMEEIEALCNRILLMDEGIILEDTNKADYKIKHKALGTGSLEDIFLKLTGTALRDTNE